MHSEPHQTNENLLSFIAQVVSERLQLEEISDGLAQTDIGTRTNGSLLWADITHQLSSAPEEMESNITKGLKKHSSVTGPRDAEELNVVLAWLSHAGRPLTVAELDAVLQRLSPSGEKVPSLEERITSKYASLIKLTRDDGLFTNLCGVDMNNGMFFSAPTTTTVGFAHDAISKYFQNGVGKFSADQTTIPLGVTNHEAHSILLRTCLEVYINPGQSDQLKNSKTLQGYADNGWFFHMAALSEIEAGFSTDESISDRSELACLLYHFLHDENIVREWCYDLNADCLTADKAETVIKCITAWTQDHQGPLPSGFESWLTSCAAKPAEILVPVARASALGCFQGEWVARPSLLVVTQIKALCDGGDTNDKGVQPQSSGVLSPEILIEAARWFQLDESAHWNRKLAVALRDSEHHTEAIVYFERALELDPDSVEARGELATVYEQQGDLVKVIELELENEVILRKHACHGDDEHTTLASSSSLQNLSRCYSMIADAYQEMGAAPMAFKYWRLAVKTGEIEFGAVDRYLQLLDEQWRLQDILELFQLIQDHKAPEGYDRLVALMLLKPWPDNVAPYFFRMLALAATHTNQLPWLLQAYERAIEAAKRRSHLTALVLKYALSELHKIYAHNYGLAEALIDEIAPIVSVKQQTPIEALENVKTSITRDYCRICVRKTLEAETQEDKQKYLQAVSTLASTCTEPFDTTGIVTRGDHVHVYLALLYRLNGETEDAASTLRPFMQHCISTTLANMIFGRELREIMDSVWALGESLLALDHVKEARDLFHFVHNSQRWECSGCEKINYGQDRPAVCQYCFDIFCERCLEELEGLCLKRFCVSGHRLLKLAPSTLNENCSFQWTQNIATPGADPHCYERDKLVFRGEQMRLDDCLNLIKEEWDLGDVTTAVE